MGLIVNPFDTDTFTIKTIHSANPAAGANYAYACPAGMRIQIIGLTFHIVAAAVAVLRTVTLVATIASNAIPVGVAAYMYNTGDTEDYTFGLGMLSIDGGVTSTKNFAPLIDGIFLIPAETIATDIIDIQGADQVSEPTLLLKRWALTS